VGFVNKVRRYVITIDGCQPRQMTRGAVRFEYCMAGHVRLELRNVVAKYPFESSHRFPRSSRILATETIRV
jgi:hypothetical protein